MHAPHKTGARAAGEREQGNRSIEADKQWQQAGKAMSSILSRIMLPLDALFQTLDGLLAKGAAALVRTPRVCQTGGWFGSGWKSGVCSINLLMR